MSRPPGRKGLSKALTRWTVNHSHAEVCGKNTPFDDAFHMKVGLRLGCSAIVAIAACLAACRSSGPATSSQQSGSGNGPPHVGQNANQDGRQTATYRGRILSTDFPQHIRVPAIAAAAEMALRHRGYSITKSPVTEDYARIEGAPPKAGWFEKVVIRTRQTSARTRVEIIAEPLGDQVLSRAILEQMTAALGG
jgi:hypothetical protein